MLRTASLVPAVRGRTTASAAATFVGVARRGGSGGPISKRLGGRRSAGHDDGPRWARCLPGPTRVLWARQRAVCNRALLRAPCHLLLLSPGSHIYMYACSWVAVPDELSDLVQFLQPGQQLGDASTHTTASATTMGTAELSGGALPPQLPSMTHLMPEADFILQARLPSVSNTVLNPAWSQHRVRYVRRTWYWLLVANGHWYLESG